MDLIAIKVADPDVQICPKLLHEFFGVVDILRIYPLCIRVLKPLRVVTFVSIRYKQKATHSRDTSTFKKAINQSRQESYHTPWVFRHRFLRPECKLWQSNHYNYIGMLGHLPSKVCWAGTSGTSPPWSATTSTTSLEMNFSMHIAIKYIREHFIKAMNCITNL